MDTTNTETERRCIGCGAILQTTDPKKPGYLPTATILSTLFPVAALQRNCAGDVDGR